LKPVSESPRRRLGFFALLSGRPLRERAASLVQSFSDNCPPPDARRKSQSRPKIEKALEALYRDAAAFSREQRLGIVGRARFAKAIQDGLLGRSYPADLVMKITSAVSAKALASKKSLEPVAPPPSSSS
jgi:hypothetical protein